MIHTTNNTTWVPASLAHIEHWEEFSTDENYRPVTLVRCAGNALLALLTLGALAAGISL